MEVIQEVEMKEHSLSIMRDDDISVYSTPNTPV